MVLLGVWYTDYAPKLSLVLKISVSLWGGGGWREISQSHCSIRENNTCTILLTAEEMAAA